MKYRSRCGDLPYLQGESCIYTSIAAPSYPYYHHHCQAQLLPTIPRPASASQLSLPAWQRKGWKGLVHHSTPFPGGPIGEVRAPTPPHPSPLLLFKGGQRYFMQKGFQGCPPHCQTPSMWFGVGDSKGFSPSSQPVSFAKAFSFTITNAGNEPQEQ